MRDNGGITHIKVMEGLSMVETIIMISEHIYMKKSGKIT